MKIWKSISLYILKNRVLCLLALVVLTAFMGYQASQVQLSYELAKILPKGNPDLDLYENFKKKYGEDGSVLVLGIKTDKMTQLEVFDAWDKVTKEIQKIAGIKDVVGITNLKTLVKNETLKTFELKKINSESPKTQIELDTIFSKINKLPIYQGFIINKTGDAHLILATFDQQSINSKDRISIVAKIKEIGTTFENNQKIKVHYSGLPFVRTEFTAQVSRELSKLLGLAVLVTSLILLAFFRSFKIVLAALVVVIIGVLSSLGTIVLLGYKITLLTGLIPPLIIIIGVPNAIFLLNKYHEAYSESHDKIQALGITIEKIGSTLFLANVTTSIGFGVFALTGSNLLVEFGVVASANVMLTFLVSLVFIPIIFSYLAPPTQKSVAHLEGKRINTIVARIEFLVHNKRTIIYAIIAGLCLISVIGMSKIVAVGYIVDDLPRDNPIYEDLKFIEDNFKGVMPFEVSIDAGMNGKAFSPQILTKIKRMEKEFAKYPEFTNPISLVAATKFVYQAYRGGDPKYFVLPGIDELNKLQEYSGGLAGKGSTFASFLDKDKRHTRVSFQVADIGTIKAKKLIETLQPKIDTIFNWDTETQKMLTPNNGGYDAKITGNSVVFTKQNDYLQKNLIESTLEAIFLISLIMWMLFANWKMIPIAIIPSLVPLLITAGIMGFLGINLKASTILIYSIAFGISSDGTIYFLTRFKDELRNNKMTVRQAVSNTILSTGISMFYTAIILFSGFFIFVSSSFKGTQALGLLVSITLLVAMICNLILLPAFLMTLNKKQAKSLL